MIIVRYANFIENLILNTFIIIKKLMYMTNSLLYNIMYNTVDEFQFIELFKNIIPKVIIFEIFQYTYSKCIDCNKYLLKKFKCGCGAIRCHYHAFLNVEQSICQSCYNSGTMYNNNTIKTWIKCIIPRCREYAWFGYKDCVLYCKFHAKNKYKLLRYLCCYVEYCSFVTNKIQYGTTYPYCIKHRYRYIGYIYNYVKN